MNRPVIWCFGGLDPSGGAGIAQDIRVGEGLGVHVCPLVTAITGQHGAGLVFKRSVSVECLERQVEPLMARFHPSVIKIGMLPDMAIVQSLVRLLSRLQVPVVMDPVMVASGGGSLSCAETIQALIAELLPRVTVLTPNLQESSILSGFPLPHSPGKMLAAARKLRQLGPQVVIVKGGHLVDEGSWTPDCVADDFGEYWLHGPKQPRSVRGSGCLLATALAAAYAKTKDWREAAVIARSYLQQAMVQAYEIDDLSFATLRTWEPQAQWMPLVTDDASLPSRGLFASSLSQKCAIYPVVNRAQNLALFRPPAIAMAQLRVKDLEGQRLERELQLGTAWAKHGGGQLYINDHWELALKLRAHGVHLGQSDLPSADLDQLHRQGLSLGISTHNYWEACRALAQQPTYIALGPILPTQSKKMPFPAAGWDKVVEWTRLFPVPVIAIGGLKAEHFGDAWRAGAAGVAMISDISEHPSPAVRVQQWIEAREACCQMPQPLQSCGSRWELRCCHRKIAGPPA